MNMCSIGILCAFVSMTFVSSPSAIMKTTDMLTHSDLQLEIYDVTFTFWGPLPENSDVMQGSSTCS
jgi:hypothetical protein